MTEPSVNNFHARSATKLQLRKTWLWLGYTHTPGLDSYRQAERYSAWWFTHCQLKHRDVDYAAACTRFYVQLVSSALLAIALSFALRNTYSPSVSMLSSSAAGCAAFLFCRIEQRRRNVWIGRQFTAQQIPVA
jgi:hypothetical protein